ncbi:MAG: DUF4434 domain-containing protein [Planctomycetota bacterium]|jgi:hypothetical protein
MLDPARLKKITGTFVTPFPNDTGINNWGRKEWEAEFALMKSIGIDTIILLRSEFERDNYYVSGMDPRFATWPEDNDLVSMYFRLCEEYEMTFYVGGYTSCTSLYMGDWEDEVDGNIELFKKLLDKYAGYNCWKGFYLTTEAIPWHYSWPEIIENMAAKCKELDSSKPTLLSPSFKGLKGDLGSYYSIDEFKKVYGRMFDKLKGKLNHCAWQDKINKVAGKEGEALPNDLDDWYTAAKEIQEKNNIELWANVETFGRPNAVTFGSNETYRQIDYRVLHAKLEAASRHAEKLITFEFSTCMSPNAEWGSSGRLLDRYLEMVGIDRSDVAWP